MTDKEIIKALECCTDPDFQKCNECPLNIPHEPCSKIKLPKISLNLINRQKAEIEKYKQEQSEMTAMLDRLGVILFGSREEWEKKLIAYIDKQRKEDENANH